MTVPATLSRVDTFSMPLEARDKLLPNIRWTLEALSNVPGFLGGEILSSTEERAAKIVTIVRWRDAASMRQARDTVVKVHAERGFDAAEFYRLHDVTLDRADYPQIETYPPAAEAA